MSFVYFLPATMNLFPQISFLTASPLSKEELAETLEDLRITYDGHWENGMLYICRPTPYCPFPPQVRIQISDGNHGPETQWECSLSRIHKIFLVLFLLALGLLEALLLQQAFVHTHGYTGLLYIPLFTPFAYVALRLMLRCEADTFVRLLEKNIRQPFVA